MEMDPTQNKPKKVGEKEKSSLTERLEVAMSSLVTVFPETDLDFLVSREGFFRPGVPEHMWTCGLATPYFGTNL